MRSPLVSTVVERFLERKQHALRPTTILLYRAHLTEFVGCCRNVAVNQVKSEHVWQYVADLRSRGITNTGINMHLRSVKACLRWAARRDVGLLAEAPHVEMLRLPPHRKRPPLTVAQVKRLISLASPRDAAIIAVTASSGLRIGEVLHLQWMDYDSSRRRIEIVAKTEVGWTPKDHAYRAVHLSTQAATMLNSYRDRLPAPLQEPEAWMFISKQGGRLTTVQKLMRRLFNEAGISSRGVLMHGLRKGAATSMLRGGADLETVRTVLGHSSVLVTQAYLQTDDDALLAAADRSLF